jgi:hypothetical protein
MAIFLSIALLAAAAAGGQQPPVRADSGEHAADPRNKMICKRFLETGSLVRGYRTCKTKAEWDRERDNIRNTRTNSDSCSLRGNGGAC